MQASEEVVGAGASSTGASSIQFTMFVENPEETWLHRHQADPRTSYVHRNTDWAAEELTGKLCCALRENMTVKHVSMQGNRGSH